MNKFDLTLKITHPTWDEPVVTSQGAAALNLNYLLKQLKLSNKQRCDIQNYGKTSWEDSFGASHTLSVQLEA